MTPHKIQSTRMGVEYAQQLRGRGVDRELPSA